MDIKVVCSIIISAVFFITYIKNYKLNKSYASFFDRYFELIHCGVFLIFAIAYTIGKDNDPFFSILIFGSLIVYIILIKSRKKNKEK